MLTVKIVLLGACGCSTKMFDEHVEFTNPGQIFGALTLEALKTDSYRASHRNRLLAEAFYLTGEVEKYGTGLVRIRRLIAEEWPHIGLALSDESGAFHVAMGRLEQETSSEGLNEGLRSLLSLVSDNPGIQAKDAGRLLERPIKTIERQVKVLTEKGLIERRGSRKTGGYWVIAR